MENLKVGKLKTIQIKGKDYVTVNERINYFRSHYKNWKLRSEIKHLTDETILMRAWVEDENGVVIADAHAQEFRQASMINKTNYVENCETSAWGRALANLGIGVDTAIASADDLARVQEPAPKPQPVNPNKFNPQDAIRKK